MPTLRQIYDNTTFGKFYDNLMNTLNIVNMTWYINVNIKMSLIYVISQDPEQVGAYVML